VCIYNGIAFLKKQSQDFFSWQTKGPFTQAIFVAQLNAIFVAPKLQLQYRACKPTAISVRFYRRDVAVVSNLFET